MTLSVWLVMTRAIRLLSIEVPICCSSVAFPIILLLGFRDERIQLTESEYWEGQM